MTALQTLLVSEIPSGARDPYNREGFWIEKVNFSAMTQIERGYGSLVPISQSQNRASWDSLSLGISEISARPLGLGISEKP
jgi:hypothetical protein